jgi:RNA polymerase sigma factor (sigma-70 family)
MRNGPFQALIRQLRRVVSPRGDDGLTDAELLDRFVSRRDEGAFELLMWRHGPMVLATCRRVLKHTADVEDAFQATFLALVRKADSIGKREAVSLWLYKVAYRTALLARSRSANRSRHEQRTLVRAEAGADRAALHDDLRVALDEEVNRLPEKYRLPVVLCCLEGKTNEAAARQLGCPEGTVYSRLARARERLRVRLTRRGLALSAAGLTAALAREAAAAPAPLLAATIKATVATVAGPAAAGGAVSARVAALTEGVLQTMSPSNWKVVIASLLAVGILGAGAGTLTYRATAEQAAAPPLAVRPAVQARADDQAEQRAQLDQAIKALGGEAKLNKLQTLRVTGKVTTVLGNGKPTLNMVGAFQALERARLELADFKLVYNGDKIWRKNRQGTQELTGEGKEWWASFGEEVYALRLAQMPVLLKDKAFQLAPLGEIKIDDKPAIAMKVTHKGRSDVDLYFDKKSGLPVKCEMRMKGYTGKLETLEEATFEFFLSDYKETDGVKYFTKITVKADGKQVMEIELSEVAPQEKLDDETFAKP